MKRFATSIIAAALLALGASASAGVVLTQETTSDYGNGSKKSTRTVMTEGTKQKIQMESSVAIIDLDKGMMYMLNPTQKTYMEMAFPPSGPMAAMAQSMGGMNIQFKKLGSKKTIAGYQCEEYTGSGHMMMGEYTVTACFATGAPGSSDYAAFTKKVAAKLKGTAMAGLANQPDGVPMELDSTTKMTNFQVPGMSPEQSKALGQMMASRAPTVTKTVTTSVKSASLSADTFVVPADYKKAEMPNPMMGGMGASAGAGMGANAGGMGGMKMGGSASGKKP